ENISLLKRKKAGKVAVRKLKKAKSFMDLQDDNSFYDELSSAMLGYLGDKFSIPGSEMSKDAAITAFTNSNIEQKVSDDFVSIIDQCEMARYSTGGSADSLEDVYQKAVNSINNIEKQVK
ncbi:MAG: hypothetical protein IH948_09865, partial [Bacteroidetes bacterium]|nr:hypothetical protein [Bacteroidota bacterium]